MVRPTTCGPNRSKFSAHTRESTESSPPSMPCSWRQLRSGNCQPRMAVKIAMPSASADSGPAIPSSDIDMATTTLVISGSFRPGRHVRPLGDWSEPTAGSLHPRKPGTMTDMPPGPQSPLPPAVRLTNVAPGDSDAPGRSWETVSQADGPGPVDGGPGFGVTVRFACPDQPAKEEFTAAAVLTISADGTSVTRNITITATDLPENLTVQLNPPSFFLGETKDVAVTVRSTYRRDIDGLLSFSSAHPSAFS